MIKSWILAARPKTLPAAIVPVVLGVVLAFSDTSVLRWWLAGCTLLSAVCIQIGTNFFNDVLDYRKGADTTERLGPARMAADGAITPRQLNVAAVAVLILACLFAIPLILERGVIMLAIGIPSLYFAYGYTGGPVPLAYRGLGEIFVLVFFGLIAVPGTYFVQTGIWSGHALLLGFQIGCLATALIAVNNLRDTAEDARSGKRTLAVRLGTRFARIEIAAFLVAPHIAGLAWLTKADFAWILPLILLIPSAALIRKMAGTAPSSAYNRLLAGVAAILVGFGLFATVGLLLKV